MLPFFKKRTKTVQPPKNMPESEILKETQHKSLSLKLEDNIEQFQSIFQHDMDFLIRKFNLYGTKPAALLFLKSLVGKEEIERDIIRPLQENAPIEEIDFVNEKDRHEELDDLVISDITENVLYYSDMSIRSELSPLIQSVSTGKSILLIDGISKALELDTMKLEKRSVEQPETERVVRGPRDGFIEQLSSNVALLRYRLPLPDLRIEQTEVGVRTKTKLAICYIEDIVNDQLLQEVKSRIEAIQMDGVLDAGYIEQFIQDNPYSPFPQVQNTERPDKVVGNLLEGRVAILVEGTPFALIAPATFNQFYQTSEDYNERWIISSAIRIIRIFALVFSLTFSSFYVTVLSFHPELIPSGFVVAASSGRQGVPFPVFVEVLVMELAMEILREATVRMPQQVGGALSIVGVLVVGQAAVQAGFVGPITVVIIALSAIASFATPSYNAATAFRLLRFPLILLAGTFGLLGLAVGIILVINHMIGLRSFGVPYMFPFAPGNAEAIKDSFFRAPFNWMKNRPNSIKPKDKKRVGSRVNDKASYNFIQQDGEKSDET